MPTCTARGTTASCSLTVASSPRRAGPHRPDYSRGRIPGSGHRFPGARPVAGAYVSVQINVDLLGQNIVGDAANEPSIAVDPTDPKTVVYMRIKRTGKGLKTKYEVDVDTKSFKKPVKTTDTVTASAIAQTSRDSGRHRYAVLCSNQDGEVLINGTAEVSASG